MSTIKTDAIVAVSTNGNLDLSGQGTGGVAVSDYLILSKGADIASATALTLGKDGSAFDVTGTTAITSIGTQGVGSHVTLHFDGALTFTHHATDLILPGAANITTAAGDIAVMYEYASGDWRCVSYTKASGEAVVAGGGKIVQVVNVTSGAAQTSTATTWVFDDTTPQNTEGTEWQTLAITPTNSSNKLLIEVVLNSMFHNQATHKIGAALFQDSNADALSSGLRVGPTAQWGGSIVFSHYMTAGTTSSTTFKVRFGTATAGTHSINTDHNSARFNGTIGSTITITEIAV